MTLVQNRLRLLSGNSLLVLLIGVLVLTQSCGSLSPASTGGTKDKPTKTKPQEEEETLPPIEGTRVYDPVQQKWVTVEAKPKEKLDTIVFAEAPTSQIPPITMDGVDNYLPDGLSGTEIMGQYNVSVLLPFMANRTNAEADKITDSRSNYALQFYSGMKLALEKLEGTDLGLNINVIDTESNPEKMSRLLQSRQDLRQSNIIIGPYRRDNIKLVAEFAKQEGKLMISPYSASTNLTEGNPNFIQVSPSLFTHCENLLQHARNEFEPEEILLMSRDIPIELMGVAAIQKEHFFFRISIDQRLV
ncbi:MAG: ABC transporter substrate-binding protein [Bacteroidota bacterium]